MSEPTRDLLLCAAAFLEQGRTVDRLSRPLTAAALIGIPAVAASAPEPPWVLIGFAALIAGAGLAEAYLAIRVGFDAALFRHVAVQPGTPDFGGTDDALTQLGLLPAAKRGRPAGARVAGARRLFRFQILALVIQVLSVPGACIGWTA